MKKLITILGLLFISGIGSQIYSQQDAFTRTLNLKKGGAVKVEVNPGDINIKTWNKEEVLVKVSGIDEDELEDYEIKSSGDVVSIKYVGNWGWGNSADYSITVPSKVSLDLYTTGGDIQIHSDIDGNVEVNTMGGDISVESISGNGKIETMGGDISFRNISGKASITTQGGDITGNDINGSAAEIKTMGGDIELHKIKNVRKITTFGGNIEVNESIGDVELITFGGNIALYAAQNSVVAKTYGGNIMVGSAKGLVDVNTAAGNIELRQISGSVKARTSAGNIYVDLTPFGNDESKIRTDAGDIVFSIPSNSRVNIEAKAIYSGWGKDNNNAIRSDFSGDVRDRSGDVVGDFIVNGGGTKIELKTTSGKIQIKKKN